MQREIWTLAPWGTWQFFLVLDSCIIELSVDGAPVHSSRQDPEKPAPPGLREHPGFRLHGRDSSAHFMYRSRDNLSFSTLPVIPHREIPPLRAQCGPGLVVLILFNRPYWMFFQRFFEKVRLNRANREIKGFDEEKTGLNRPYWIESVFPDDLQFVRG